jgi:hypothetical protein
VRAVGNIIISLKSFGANVMKLEIYVSGDKVEPLAVGRKTSEILSHN